MWDLSGPGLEPVSPALAGGFLTTAPPGKSLPVYFMVPGILNILSKYINFQEDKGILLNSNTYENFLVFVGYKKITFWVS